MCPPLPQLLPGVKVHRGFLNQANSFIEADHPEHNLTAVVEDLSGGQQPWRVVVTGEPDPGTAGRRGLQPRSLKMCDPAIPQGLYFLDTLTAVPARL
jgi:hypothetical protein